MVVAVTGEWFQSEYNTDFDWANLAASGDFTVAVPNHRVGAFGFLNTCIQGAVGNAAIEDIPLALTWLQNNVRRFHGDPEDMVALGLGSGAFLLSVILMSPELNVFRRLPAGTLPDVADTAQHACAWPGSRGSNGAFSGLYRGRRLRPNAVPALGHRI